jgi:hypothetical protein
MPVKKIGECYVFDNPTANEAAFARWLGKQYQNKINKSVGLAISHRAMEAVQQGKKVTVQERVLKDSDACSITPEIGTSNHGIR